MTWSEKETLAAAEKATSLSELLEQVDLFKDDGLRWLEHKHIDKFLNGINEEESIKLRHFAAKWSYPTSEGNTSGFPLLDSLWEKDPKYNFQTRALDKSSGPGIRQGMVLRLAELKPDWVGRWWVWRRANGNGNIYYKRPPERAVINALSKCDFEGYSSVLADEIVATIIGERPEMIAFLSRERRGPMLRAALDSDLRAGNVVQALAKYDIPSDATAVIDSLLDSDEQSNAISSLDELVENWSRSSGSSDPVAVAMTRGHERLEALLRSQWHGVPQSSGGRSEKDFWSHPLSYGQAGRAFAAAARACPDHFRLELGFSIGLRIAEEEREPSPELISEHLNKINIDSTAGITDVLLPMVELWASLRTLAKYEANSWQHETELVGLRAKIASLAATAPDLWAQSLPWILPRSSKLGDVAQAVTLELSTTAPVVRRALENACSDEDEDLRLKARGLWTLLHGLEDPESGLARTLADAAAHFMDGTPIFPHPLEPLSATWLGSIGVEQAIANAVRRATRRFADEVRDQGGDIEEALTKALVKEIEVEFREVQPRLKLLGSSRSRSPAPILSVQQRPVSKSIEEPVYGCDLAWLLNATVSGRYRATWVDLVQVKKSRLLQRHGKRRPRTDSWRIESKQLNDILKWSATAAYWLIASAGEVLVIPAKHLVAIRRGNKKSASAETFTVGYHEVRAVAIPLEQYLVDLLIGQWVGTISEDVVRFAQGENSNIRPRAVIEVTISVGQDHQ